MNSVKFTKRWPMGGKRLFSFLVTLAVIVSSVPTMPGVGNVFAAQGLGMGDFSVEKPILTVSGTKLVGAEYTKDNVSKEKSYTLTELKAMTDHTKTNLYSAINTTTTKSIFKGEGINVLKLLAAGGFTPQAGDEVKVISMGAGLNAGFSATTDLTEKRYYFPGIHTADETGRQEVEAILAWAVGGERGNKDPDVTVADLGTDALELMVGQTDINDKNNPLYAKGVNFLACGDLLADTAITIDGTGYARTEMLMQDRAQRDYTYSTKEGEKTDTVRGVPLALFAASHDGSEIVSFETADHYDVSAYNVELATAIAKNYLIAYEKEENGDFAGIFNSDDNGNSGCFTLYGDDIKPMKMVNKITIAKAKDTSRYKHITNGGQPGSAPYNIDAITSATLTVEGPGVESTTPIRMADLESTKSSNIHKGNYTDIRNGQSATFQYEGVTVKSIVDGLVNSQVEKVDENVKVVFKNRWRQDVATITYQQLKDASAPVMLAYGTGTTDESIVAPFVFDGANGYKAELGNDDGCLKLVYDATEPALSSVRLPDQFSSVAYLYIERGEPRPGFKHTKTSDDAYKNVANMEQLITFTGSVLGREVNYTTKELEDMVAYDGTDQPTAGGLGYRASYGLSNTTYWYVNEYEGVKLWELLTQKLGLDANQYKEDDRTLVSFAAWDNYKTQAQFSMKQLAHPELFYYYEKSPLDVGTNRPTKEQLATAEYQPNNQGDGWEKDANGYPVKKGYPVMLAYGVNGYPYVRDSSLPGYSGGLGNDGGPLKVIFGKADNMNRADLNAADNYAYFYNNGSYQLQRLQEIYVGDQKRYSTHKDNPSYQSMKDQQALTIEVKNNGSTETKTYTLEQLEDILYGSDVDKRDREGQGRQEKGYYAYKDKNGLIEDLFEGVNLDYLLTEEVGMPGVLGKVSFYSKGVTSPALEIELSEIKKEGYNSLRQTENLGSMIAFAKNGYPLVAGQDAATGYVKNDSVTGKTIKNTDGPLMFVRGQTEAEKDADEGKGVVGQDGPAYVANVTKIVVDLEPDFYAHTGTDYQQYNQDKIAFQGAVKDDGVELTVGEIEKLQKYMVTDSYTIGGTTVTYRGIDLGKLLADKAVAASALMEEITVKNAAGQEKKLAASELSGSGKKVILAYGIKGAVGADPAGKPLVPQATDPGYDAAYLNAGGPLRLVIDQGTAADCLNQVTEITVKAAALSGWKHTAGVYKDYENNKIEFSGTNLKNNKTMTVSELENLADSYKVFDQYKVGNNYYFEGIDLLKLLRDYIGLKDGAAASAITVYAKDNYAINFTATQLKNGVNGKPMMLAYGQGVSPSKGLPLVDGNDTNDIRSGYDANIGNAFGPLRLIVEDNTGWCNKWVTKIVVGSEGGTDEPQDADFTVKNGTNTAGYNIKKIKGITTGSGGKATSNYSYTKKDVLYTDYVQGVYLKDLLAEAKITGDQVKITINCTDGFESTDKATGYRDISLKEIADQNYFLAYDAGSDAGALDKISDEDKSGKVAAVRIYRNYDDGSSWYNCIKNVSGITVTGASGEEPDPGPGEVTGDFILYGGLQGDKGFTIKEIKTLDGDIGTQVTTGTWFGDHDGDQDTPKQSTTDQLKGIYLKDLLKNKGITDNDHYSLDIVTTDDYKHASYVNISLAAVAAQDYFVAYDVNGGKVKDADKKGNEAAVRIYRKYNAGVTDQDSWYNRITNVKGIRLHYSFDTFLGGSGASGSLPDASVRDIETDATGGMWVGTNGKGAYYKPGNSNQFTINTLDAGEYQLKSDVVQSIAIDARGGVWFTQSNTYNPAEAEKNKGVAYLSVGSRNSNNNSSNGDKFTYYDTSVTGTIPHNYVQTVKIDAQGNVWFGSFGGLTKFEPQTDEWKTWTKADGLPAESVDAIAFDSKGGVWIGCYPDAADASTGPFSGGYAYMDASGKITAYPAGKDETIDSSRLADCWVRDIAVDQNDGAWIVRSGSYATLVNEGGRVDYVSADGKVTHYSGKKLIPDLATVPGNMEIRQVEVDADGNIWFGTSGLGIYKMNPDLTLKAHFSADGKNWPEGPVEGGVDNIFALNIAADGMLYSGSNAGVVAGKLSQLPENLNLKYDSGKGDDDGDGDDGDDDGKGDGPQTGSIGDSTAKDCDLAITGAVEKPGYFTIKGLKNAKGLKKTTATYNWLNSYGTKGKTKCEGVTLENLLDDVMSLDRAKSITVRAADGYERNFNLDSSKYGVYWSDRDGNKMMLAWTQDGSKKDLTLIIGQGTESDANKPMWVSDVAKIIVNSSPTKSGSGTKGSYESKKEAEGEQEKTTKGAVSLNTDTTLKYITGYEGDLFKPDAPMSRAEVIVLFVRLLAEQLDENKSYTPSFADVKEGKWYTNAIGYMEQQGIIKGDKAGEFRPGDQITRAELVAIAVRFSGANTAKEDEQKEGAKTTNSAITTKEKQSQQTFSDVPSNFWAADDIAIAVEKGWLTGYENGEFHPNDPITRAEVIKIVNRMLNRSANQDYIEKNKNKLTTFKDVPPTHWAYEDIMEAANGHQTEQVKTTEKTK